MAKLRSLAVLCLSLSTTGCVLYPYVRNVTASIHSVRVLDAVTEEDIPDARVALETGTITGEWAYWAPMKWLDVSEAKEAIGEGEMSRRSDGSFEVPRRWVWGYVGFFAMAPNDGSPHSVPYARIAVVAPGYHALSVPRMGRFVGEHSETTRVPRDWAISGSRSSDVDSSEKDLVDVACCESCEDGVLRFYLRKVGLEIAEDRDYFSRRAPNGLVQPVAATEPDP